jgi:iron complex outermembrane receptor protein
MSWKTIRCRASVDMAVHGTGVDRRVGTRWAIATFGTFAVFAAASLPGTRAAAPDVDADDGLDEIIVTAGKRPEPLQKTPAAITVLTGDTLIAEQITDIRAAQNFVPSVRFQQENAATEIYIRGVGSTLDFPQITPPNVFNMNGIPVPREATGAPLYDVDQLEVLPGPQGTLYGSSALGGAVNVNFRRPSADPSASLQIEAGNYGLAHVSAAGGLPVSSTLAVRGAVDSLQHEGYETSGADSERNLAGRLSASYQPTADVSLYAWGSTVAEDGHPPNLVPRGINPLTGALQPNSYLTSNPWNDEFPAPYAAALPFGQPRAEGQHDTDTMAGGELAATLAADTTLTWIPSYLRVETSPNYWLGAFPGNESNNYRQVTNELRLAAVCPWGAWLGGLYAYDLDSNGTFTFGSFTPGEGVPVSIVSLNRLTGEAAFGQVTVDLGSQWRLIVGGRYSRDDRIGRGDFDTGAGLAPYTYARNFTHADYKAGIDYEVAPHVMLYAVTQTGYQPGTFNAFASTPSLNNAVNQATLTAYTAGVKSRMGDLGLTLNDEFFYYDYRGLFASAYNTVLNSDQTFNAQKTEIYGNQWDFIYEPGGSDQLSVSVGYLHARNVQFTLPDGGNFDGYQLQYAPDWTVSAGYHHDFAQGGGYWRLAANTRYEDSFYADFSHTPGGRQAPYIKTDASLTYTATRGGWTVGAWVKNVSNIAVIAATAGGSNLPALAQGATAFLEPPRTFGLRVTWTR